MAARWCGTALLFTLLACPSGAAPPSASSTQAFEKQVRPLLVEHCQACHGPKKQMGGLRVDSRAALLKGGDTGPALEPGKPDASRLIQAIHHQGDLKMPPRKKLPAPAIAVLVDWVRAGAPWPAEERVTHDADAWKRHWAFQPVRRPDVPLVRNPAATQTPIDRFVLARLEARNLNLAPQADRRTLIRRLSFDLLGLPPTPDEVDAFVADTRPDAYERLVERFLASPRHGERWARYWLDIARYADTKGYVFFEESDYPWGWTYRDYVIDAFNEDRPYNRFLIDQLAADQVDGGRDRRALRALGFLSLGGRFMNNVHDIIDDRIDVVTRGLMGLTVSCARCHEHKFDPVPIEDYYSLYGVFASVREPTVPPLYEEPPATPLYAKFQAELSKREKALATFVDGKFQQLRQSARTRAAEYMLAAHARRGQPRADDFMLIADGNDLNPTMLIRWQSYLERTARTPHRVWGAWHALAALPEKEFATQVRAVVARLANDPGINPRIKEIFVTPPATLAEAANRYGKLLNEIDKLWESRRASQPSLERLPDAAAEEIRQVLHGPEAAANLLPGQISNLELLPDRPSQGELQKLQKEVEQWRATGPGAPPRANVLVDLPQPITPVVFKRGNPNNPGSAIPRRAPQLLAGPTRAAFATGSGRLELARLIADPNNPLTARVMVNRLWMYHLGTPLVPTVGDFGMRADAPTHPELLDWLADEFVRSGWSIKHLHRLIVTSATYRQASADRPDASAVDPENTLLWHFPRRPLDLEALRDSLLSVSGELDSTIGGPSVRDALNPGSRRRTLYSWVDRLHVPGLFRTFDFPSPDASSARRDRTLVPQQVLFLLNSPAALHTARSLAARSEVGAPPGLDGRIRQVYRLALSRPPDPDELTLAREFLDPSKQGGAAWPRLAQALLLSNEFIFID